jgi:hypothetical protein
MTLFLGAIGPFRRRRMLPSRSMMMCEGQERAVSLLEQALLARALPDTADYVAPLRRWSAISRHTTLSASEKGWGLLIVKGHF